MCGHSARSHVESFSVEDDADRGDSAARNNERVEDSSVKAKVGWRIKMKLAEEF